MKIILAIFLTTKNKPKKNQENLKSKKKFKIKKTATKKF